MTATVFNTTVFNMYHKERKCRVIFTRRITGGYNTDTKSVYSCQVQDDNAVFKIVNLEDMTETDFLRRLKETLEQGFVLDGGE